jgi:hypothetical protein
VDGGYPVAHGIFLLRWVSFVCARSASHIDIDFHLPGFLPNMYNVYPVNRLIDPSSGRPNELGELILNA